MSKYVIEQICKNTSLSTYLEGKGAIPRRDSDGKKVYNCPLPDHSADRTPSFYVYDKGDHEDYYCYGCKSGGGIIQLVSAMENISIRDSISKLSNGLDIDMSDILDNVVREVILATGGTANDEETVLQIVMYLSTLCHDFLRRTSFDPKEIEVCDKFSLLCDNLMKSRDRKGLEDIMAMLPEHLSRRYQSWATKKETEERNSIMTWRV